MHLTTFISYFHETEINYEEINYECSSFLLSATTAIQSQKQKEKLDLVINPSLLI